MFNRVNKKQGTVEVGNVTRSGLGIFYLLPLPGVKKASRLAVRGSNGQRVELTNSQVRALLRVVRRGNSLVGKRSSVTV